jgi:response regulator RpfG family c-di-GMP phosphodiesterase
MVAQISRCIADCAIETCPEHLTGVLGTQSPEEVKERKEELLAFIYHAALCHDFGKLSIIDTVFVYGRNLLDMEFDLIRTHPRTGYDVLRKHESTRDYADIALYHHRFYNDSAGYPDDCLASDSPLKPVIDIVHIADCLDAATDPVGRTYRSSKTLETVIREFENGKGLCYADWVTDLLADEELQNRLRRYLSEGRRDNYRMTYFLLRDMQKGSEKD